MPFTSGRGVSARRTGSGGRRPARDVRYVGLQPDRRAPRAGGASPGGCRRWIPQASTSGSGPLADDGLPREPTLVTLVDVGTGRARTMR